MGSFIVSQQNYYSVRHYLVLLNILCSHPNSESHTQEPGNVAPLLLASFPSSCTHTQEPGNGATSVLLSIAFSPPIYRPQTVVLTFKMHSSSSVLCSSWPLYNSQPKTLSSNLDPWSGRSTHRLFDLQNTAVTVCSSLLYVASNFSECIPYMQTITILLQMYILWESGLRIMLNRRDLPVCWSLISSDFCNFVK